MPEDLAAEARTLQQQHRDREIDLFAAAHRSASRFGGGGGGSGASRALRIGGGHRTGGGQATLDGIYNVASSLLHETYMYPGGGGASGAGTRDLSRLRRGLRQLNDADFIFNAPGGGLHGLSLTATAPGGSRTAAAAAAAAALERARNGRQLLDHESLACLLVLLFIDEPRMNMTKLHRVVRNLCIHGPTRAWVIRALLSILEKVSGRQDQELDQQQQQQQQNLAVTSGKEKAAGRGVPSGTSKQPMMGLSSRPPSSTPVQQAQPSWLTMVCFHLIYLLKSIFDQSQAINNFVNF